MANQGNHFEIKETFGDKPIQLGIGENADGDCRVRIQVSYTYQGVERHRVWLSKRHLADLHKLIGQYLYPEFTPLDDDNDTTPPPATNGSMLNQIMSKGE